MCKILRKKSNNIDGRNEKSSNTQERMSKNRKKYFKNTLKTLQINSKNIQERLIKTARIYYKHS
jgi:hypothetical protein